MERQAKYKPQATVKEFHVTSRVSVKIREEFYTFEYSETRFIDSPEKINMDKETMSAWDFAHSQVDKQVKEVIELNKK